MTITVAQGAVDVWVRSTGRGYFDPLTNLGRLTEEVGELARILVRRSQLRPKPGDDISDEALLGEFGDVLLVLFCLANQTGIDLERAVAGVLEKIRARDVGRHDR